MPKHVFWPFTMVVMGLIFLASNLGLLPKEFWSLWPVILIVVGLGGLITSDRKEWIHKEKVMKSATSSSRSARRKK